MKLGSWIKIILLVYCLIGIGIYYLQDYFLFHPEPLQKKDRFDFAYPHHELNIPFSPESNINIVQFLIDTTKHQRPKGVVLYFHGNKKNISWYAKNVPMFTNKGYEVWMIDYPGFGKSTGQLTEKRIYEYADQMYKVARRLFAADSIILYGKSMGTGIAAQLASRRNAKVLVLETPYYSVHSLFSHYLPFYPIARMIHYEFPTYNYLPKVVAPVIIFHGDDDGVIPYSNAKKLVEVLKPKDHFITIENGSHNDLPSYPAYQQTMDSILK